VKSTSQMNILDKTISDKENRLAFNKHIEIAIKDIENHIISKKLGDEILALTKTNSCRMDDNFTDKTPQLYLEIRLSGYGSLKERWKKVLIVTGIAEGVVQGVVVATATHNPWLGIGVASEEFVPEYLSWNGIDWLLGETYAPVTLEGHLIYQGNIIWQDSYFVSENEDELDKDEKKDKSKQLLASLHKAESELLDDLSDYLRHEVVEYKR